MRLWLYGLGFALAVGSGIGLGAGCAKAGATNPSSGGAGGAGGGPSGTGGVGTTSTGTGPATGTGGSGATGTGGNIDFDGGQPDGMESCAKFTAEAKQEPAAMLIVLDRSASMSTQNKWGTAQLSIVQAIDKDVFDTMSLGLSAFPSGFTPPPTCLCDALGGPGLCGLFLPMGVACGYPVLPQIAMNMAGMNKSNAASGVRHDIYQYLVSHGPETMDPSDASPIYDSLNGAYSALKAQQIDKRIAVLITDGGFSCTSLSNPVRPGYYDGACNDWEYPATVNTLITGARTDATKPIFTFIVGVPGSNSTGQMQGAYATAPYSMKLALSTYAVSGSPDTVDPNCAVNAVFTQNGAAPANPCHIDLSSGAFNPDVLADAIQTIRGKALGCVYDLPEPPPGETIDPALVNVTATIGMVSATVPKRSDPNDTCQVDGCWDYNATNQVELLGKACEDISAAESAKVEIYVGCTTILK